MKHNIPPEHNIIISTIVGKSTRYVLNAYTGADQKLHPVLTSFATRARRFADIPKAFAFIKLFAAADETYTTIEFKQPERKVEKYLV